MLDFSHTMGEEILTVNNPSKPLYRKGFRDFEMIEFHRCRYIFLEGLGQVLLYNISE